MRIEHLLFSLIALLLSFLFVFCGLFLLLFPDAVLNLKAIGITMLSLGVFLLLFFPLLVRRRYLLLKMGGVAIHERLVRHFAKESLQALFPNHTIDCDVILHKKGKVEILATIPYLSEMRREQKLEEIETHLSASLLKYCGCKDPFIFNVSFS